MILAVAAWSGHFLALQIDRTITVYDFALRLMDRYKNMSEKCEQEIHRWQETGKETLGIRQIYPHDPYNWWGGLHMVTRRVTEICVECGQVRVFERSSEEGGQGLTWDESSSTDQIDATS
jgi:hypothetical protein